MKKSNDNLPKATLKIMMFSAMMMVAGMGQSMKETMIGKMLMVFGFGGMLFLIIDAGLDIYENDEK